MLKVQNVYKYFGGLKAVENCSFEVRPNFITALIGPNGAGKSTVFNLISGILKVDSGRIFFNEQEITNQPPEKISNAGISRLFQQSRLFLNLTVEENLLLALDNEDTKFWKNLAGVNKITDEKMERVREMLRLMTLENFENTFARDLSYGQKRLVELARAILNPHTFLMLDEPVAGVNPKLREVIANILLTLKAQKPSFVSNGTIEAKETILLIEHDMRFTFSVADWVVVMQEGRVLFEGKPEEVKNNPKVLEAYLGD
jgi:branched-chain amino acid transport system ATP-binding protein/neutral amino acid transport system ATP-binding protein